MGRKGYSEDKRREVLDDVNAKMTFGEIAAKHSISITTIINWDKKREKVAA